MHYGNDEYFVESELVPRNNHFSAEDSLAKSRGSLSQKLREQQEHYDIFVSHSAKDKSIILCIVEMIEEMGYKAYVDWIDDSLSERDEIANKIKIAINKSTKLLYVHTHNSINSKWTPWEIGCFDSKKGKKNIAVLPLLSDKLNLPSYIGQEYLKQYDTISGDFLDSFLKSTRRQ